MAESRNPKEDVRSPTEVLGISVEAGEEEIRAAYLRKVREYPPDRSPAEFERIRDAYNTLKDPRRRIQLVLLDAAVEAPLTDLLDRAPAKGRFVGLKPWLDVLKEKKS